MAGRNFVIWHAPACVTSLYIELELDLPRSLQFRAVDWYCLMTKHILELFRTAEVSTQKKVPVKLAYVFCHKVEYVYLN